MILSPHEIAFLVKRHFGDLPEADQVTLVAIAWAESKGDTLALARSSTGPNLGQRDHGLWQISGRWNADKLTSMGDWRDPDINTRMARKVYNELGFKAWQISERPDCLYG